MHVLDRKKTPKGDPSFEHLEDIALHSFYARVVVLFHIRISKLAPSCDIHQKQLTRTYVLFIPISSLLSLMPYAKWHSPRRKKHPLNPNLSQRHQIDNHREVKTCLLNSNLNHWSLLITSGIFKIWYYIIPSGTLVILACLGGLYLGCASTSMAGHPRIMPVRCSIYGGLYLPMLVL